MKYIYDNKEVKLHGIFQRSRVIEPSSLIGGHSGGTFAYPIAVIEFEDGTISEVSPNEVRGIDEE